MSSPGDSAGTGRSGVRTATPSSRRAASLISSADTSSGTMSSTLGQAGREPWNTNFPKSRQKAPVYRQTCRAVAVVADGDRRPRRGTSVEEANVEGTDERLLTPGEVAALFRVDPKTVTRWAASGRITSIRTPGGHRRFRESEVRALLRGEGEPSTDGQSVGL